MHDNRGWLMQAGICSMLAAAVLLSGCGGHSVPAASGPSGGELPALISGGGELLPAPSELLTLGTAEPRTPSAFPEEDRIKHGKDYDQALPFRNVDDSGDNAEFSTHWSEGSGMTPDNLGIAIYHFEVPGYDMAPEVHYGWEDAPVDIGTAWLGLADFGTDRWHWFQCEENGQVSVPAMDPYLSPADHVFVAMVIANEGSSWLRFVHLGPPLVTAELEANPRLGITNLTVSFDASSSATSAGSITEYEWDFDGDGTYDTAGPGNTENHMYTVPGIYEAVMRVTNSYGEQATDAETITAMDAWQRSWGRVDRDMLWDCTAGPDGSVYATGLSSTPGTTYESDLLLVKYSPLGELLWVKIWQQAASGGWGEGSSGEALVIGNDDFIYIVGSVDADVSSTQTMLLQKWTLGGELVWAKGWTGADGTTSYGQQLLMRGDNIYVIGNTNAYSSGDQDIALFRFDTDGGIDWLVTYAGADMDYANDACFTGLPQPSGIAICGYTQSFGAQGNDVLLLRFDLEGVLGWQQRWDAANQQRGSAIMKDLTGNLFVAGYDGQGPAGLDDMLVLGVDGSGTSILEVAWGTADSEMAEGIAMATGGYMYICGFGSEMSGDPYGLVLLLDGAGDSPGAVDYGLTSGTDDRFNDIELYGTDKLLCGQVGAVPHLWQLTTGTLTKPLAPNWVACSGSVSLHEDESSADIAGSVVDVTTDGVVDSGAGHHDALVLVQELP